MNKEDLYSILGCTSAATTEQILTEYKARVRQFHPDKKDGTDSEFCRLQRAKEILTDPSKRRHYDTYLAMGTGMPLDEWMEHRERLQQTLHWANPSSPTPAIELKEKAGVEAEQPVDWKRHETSTINAFRNYRI
ncbi:unnamed protein product [Bursaphelenchus xylophilus]|uniref:(pine wood nematode) hypothetical protein n=1 Tax=Bursaphelenchus xylophilus TaxID=6326 RepID=A0A1I7SUD0_BURXY|nr:unnamed protein product [Bursaphelenchus xylophilus]CAG9107279.1 unnamed protein product [Bursaphelenchus xylophilus]